MKKLLPFLILLLLAVPARAETTSALMDSIFRLYIMRGESVAGGGSCFLSDQGLLTCLHCVEMVGKEHYIQMPDGKLIARGRFSAVVVDAKGQRRPVRGWVRLASDVVKLDVGDLPEDWVPLTWATELPEPYTPVRAVGYYGDAGFGNPQKGALSVGVGWFQRETVVIGKTGMAAMVEHTAPICPGFSGSPLLDPEGRVLGVNTSYGGRGLFANSYSGRIRLQPCEDGQGDE